MTVDIVFRYIFSTTCLHVISHKKSFNGFPRIDIIQTMSPNHKAIKLNI